MQIHVQQQKIDYSNKPELDRPNYSFHKQYE